MDGWWDAMKSIGKIDSNADYTICYMNLDDDVRIVLIDSVSCRECGDIPICLVKLSDVIAEELEQCTEIGVSEGFDTARSRAHSN